MPLRRFNQGLKKFFSRYLGAYVRQGVVPDSHSESNTQSYILNLFTLVGVVLTLALGINALAATNFSLAGALILVSFIFYIVNFLKNKQKLSIRFNANVLMYSLMGLMIYLVHTGGVGGTGALWIYVVPPVLLAFKGFASGLKNIILFGVCVGVMMYFPGETLTRIDYQPEYKLRLLLTFATVTFLFAFYERSRQGALAKLQSLSTKFEQQAKEDALTGLLNRRGMEQRLGYEYLRSQRNQRKLSVMIADIDHFKKVNDNYGHAVGDQVLKEIAELFNSELRQQDVAARWGGEEFLFLSPETDLADAIHLAERVRCAVAEHQFCSDEEPLNITLSMGICEVMEGSSVEQALEQADALLYQAKEQGRNKVLWPSV